MSLKQNLRIFKNKRGPERNRVYDIIYWT